MTGFAERERAFEAKYAHDEELRFLVGARRDKLLAAWAAGRLHLSAEAGAGLVASILALGDGPGHDGRVLAAIAAACSGHGAPATAGELEAAMGACGDEARRQLVAGAALPDGG